MGRLFKIFILLVCDGGVRIGWRIMFRRDGRDAKLGHYLRLDRAEQRHFLSLLLME